MTLRSRLAACMVVIFALAACAAQAQTQAQAEYKAGKTRIGADFKADKNGCARLVGNAKEVCLVKAKARQTTAQASLEFGSSGKPADQYRVLQAGAAADYTVARQTCMAQAGNARDLCVQQARAARTRTLVDAGLMRKIAEIQQNAEQERRNALYVAAAEKCDALAAAAKADCIAAAKAKFGKT